jgi:hypothetical protein
MYFTVKYNVFHKYIINATTTAINARKKLFDNGSCSFHVDSLSFLYDKDVNLT